MQKLLICKLLICLVALTVVSTLITKEAGFLSLFHTTSAGDSPVVRPQLVIQQHVQPQLVIQQQTFIPPKSSADDAVAKNEEKDEGTRIPPVAPKPFIPSVPQKLVIIRSIGNALPPRHDPNQTITNLKFILQNEKKDDNLFLRHWVVNRLVDPSIESRALEMLESAGESYTWLRFDLSEYNSIPYDWTYSLESSGKDIIHDRKYSSLDHKLKQDMILNRNERKWLTGKIVRKSKRFFDWTIRVIKDDYGRIFDEGYASYKDKVAKGSPLSREESKLSKQIKDVEKHAYEELRDIRDIYRASFGERLLYPTNQNAARNVMVDVGKKLGPKWILPLDGNCYFHPSGFQQMVRELDAMPEDIRYVVLPMARVDGDNSEALDAHFYKEPSEEPQLIMHHDAEARFDTRLTYGRRNKVGVLIQLGVPGDWQTWKWHPWEEEMTPKWKDPSIRDIDHSKEIPRAGWVMRLNSGVSHLEVQTSSRHLARLKSMKLLLNTLDRRAGAELHGWTPKKLLYFNLETMKREKEEFQNPTEDNIVLRKTIEELVSVASANMVHGPWSVTDKPEDFVAPSGDPHDYLHPAPYYHPPTKEDLANDPDLDQNVYIRRDGERVLGTEMYGPYSERYDRSRLQAMFNNVTVWTLGSFYSDDLSFAEHAAECVRVWFIRNETRMNPHLRYSQFVKGKFGDEGQNFGIIEFKDVYYFMDALRLLEGHFSNQEVSQLHDWFSAYLKWLDESRQGMEEYLTKNNHGIYYDIQKASIAAYVNRQDMFYETMYECVSRLHRHVDENGLLPEELKRPTCEHYQAFTLSAWDTMSRMAFSIGLNYYDPKIAKGIRRGNENEDISLLCHAMTNTNPLSSGRPVCEGDIGDVGNNDGIDQKRWWSLTIPLRRHCDVTRFSPPSWLESQTFPTSPYVMPWHYFEHDGIAPFWNLGIPGLTEENLKSSLSSGYEEA